MLFRTIAQSAILAGLVAVSTTAAFAEAFPTKPLRFVVPFPPGGTLDVLARTVANDLSPALGQPVVVENKPGASGVIGAEVVVQAAPDGHTLMIMSNTLVTLPALRKDMPFDPLKALAPVIELGATPTVITVHPSFAARNVAEFVALAKKTRAASATIRRASPRRRTWPVNCWPAPPASRSCTSPTRAPKPAVNDLVGGQIPMMMAPLNAVLPFIQDGKLFAIAVTNEKRAAELPNVPTVREAGIPTMAPVSSWFGILTTAGTPPATIARLNAEIAKIMRDPKVAERLKSQTFAISAGTPEQLGTLMREEAVRNAKIVADAQIKAE